MKQWLALGLAVLLAGTATVVSATELVVYTARKIITMEPALPEATAVAVADGRIVSVGTLESLKPWLAVSEVTIDRSLEDKVLLPGFIDPHVHPSLPAAIFPAPEPRRLTRPACGRWWQSMRTPGCPLSPGATTPCGTGRCIASNSTPGSPIPP